MFIVMHTDFNNNYYEFNYTILINSPAYRGRVPSIAIQQILLPGKTSCHELHYRNDAISIPIVLPVSLDGSKR
jgi:hypothetical protein